HARTSMRPLTFALTMPPPASPSAVIWAMRLCSLPNSSCILGRFFMIDAIWPSFSNIIGVPRHEIRQVSFFAVDEIGLLGASLVHGVWLGGGSKTGVHTDNLAVQDFRHFFHQRDLH